MCIACPLKSFENTGIIYPLWGETQVGITKSKSSYYQDYMLWVQHSNLLIFKIIHYGSNIQIFLFSRLCVVWWHLSVACMAWFGEKIWSWVGIPTPEGRWVFLRVWAVLWFFLKSCPVTVAVSVPLKEVPNPKIHHFRLFQNPQKS